MYGLTLNDLSFALFAAKDCAKEERRLHGLYAHLLDESERSSFLIRAVEAELLAKRFDTAMQRMAEANRHERMRPLMTWTPGQPRSTRHDANDYDEGNPGSWPACNKCGANSCDCGQ